DCGAGGFSSGGDNKNSDMYKAWIQKLVDQVGQKEVIYVLEPDAVGLASNGGCGVSNGYQGNLKTAMGLLSTNANAHIYVDIASWANQGGAVSFINDLKSAGRLAGIAINTSNYRTTSDLNSFCQTYSAATGGLHCVFDTSRNYNGSPNGEWCNARSAGVGAPPTDQTGNPLVDYHLWIKVPGESDGECTGQSSDAMVGPSAGSFFYEGFKVLWNEGYYVKEKGYPQIGSNQPWPSPSSSPPAPTSAPPTPSSAPPTPSSAPPTPSLAPPTPSSTPPTPSSAPPAPTSPPTPPSPSSQPTMVPSPPSPPPSGGAAQPYAQCGGNRYSGPTGCAQGFFCSYNNEWYSQCLPGTGSSGKIPTWGQCGGQGFQGANAGLDTDRCERKNDWYSQCVPK
ncbi:unnamed protein product, partial [Aphanomyces euteiches]